MQYNFNIMIEKVKADLSLHNKMVLFHSLTFDNSFKSNPKTKGMGGRVFDYYFEKKEITSKRNRCRRTCNNTHGRNEQFSTVSFFFYLFDRNLLPRCSRNAKKKGVLW